MKENTDYEFIPVEGQDNWNIRIKTGDYIETVFQFGALAVNEGDESLSFNFEVISSPIEDLVPAEDIGLQKNVGSILYNVLEQASTMGQNE
tara:strand:+ start:195 stop:467 length:273 start_codon:yes stop_codon:yes gene_type:complete